MKAKSMNPLFKLIPSASKKRSTQYSVGLLGLLAIGSVWASVDIAIDGSNGLSVKNNTPNTVSVDGWRFQTPAAVTQQADGFAATPKNFTYGGKTYHSLILPKGSYNPGLISANKNLSVTYQWGTKLPKCSNPGATFGSDGDCDALISTGSCSEPPAYQDATPITYDQLVEILKNPGYYDADHRYLDTLGSNGGKFSGGWLDTWYGQTQANIAIPQTSHTVSQTSVKFDPATMPTMTWMAMTMEQEFFNGDMQWMLGIGLKETMLGTSWHETKNSNLEGAFGPFEVEGATFGDRALSYIKFYPYHSCLGVSKTGGPVDLTAGLQNCGLANGEALAELYMGKDKTPLNDPKIVNAVIASWLTFDVNYAILANLNTIQFTKILAESKDRLVGICAMAPIYNLGLFGGGQQVIGTMKNTAGVINDPNACNQFPVGNSNYRIDVMGNVQWYVEANRNAFTNKSLPLVDGWITLDDLKKFYWGAGAQVCGDGKTQDGGLMKQFKLADDQCNAMWTEVEKAFHLQAAHWGRSIESISLRYDWLSNLRIAKKYLDLGKPNLNAANGDASLIIGANQGTGTDVDGRVLDHSYPFLTIQGVPQPNASGDYEVTVNANDDADATSDRGIRKVEWTINDDWSGFQTLGVTRKLPSDTSTFAKQSTYTVTIAKSIVDSWGGNSKNIWIRTTDACGNSVVKRTQVKGLTLPTIASAVLKTNVLDGNGRTIEITLDDDSKADVKFSNVSSVIYAWPTKNDSVYVVPSITNGKMTINLPTPVIGAGDGQVILKWDGVISIKSPIIDSVGPVLKSAFYLQDSPDTLYVSFSEPVLSFSASSAQNLFHNFRANKDITIDTVIANGVSYKLAVDVSTPIQEGDSINILNDGNIKDLPGNLPGVNNIGVKILKYIGPAMADQNGSRYEDTDGDGRLDRVVIRFTRDMDPSSASMIKSKFKWQQNSSPAIKEFEITNFKVSPLNAKELEADLKAVGALKSDSLGSIAAKATSFDLNNNQWGRLTITQVRPDGSDSVQVVNMEDRMGPVIADAELKMTSSPSTQSDKLVLRFSENMNTDNAQVFGTQLLKFLRSGSQMVLPHSEKLSWSGSNKVVVEFTPQLTEHPLIGDSVKIATNISGEFQDAMKNVAQTNNAWAPIRGKQVVVFYSPTLVSVDASVIPKDVKDAFGTPRFYSFSVPIYHKKTDSIPSVLGNAPQADRFYQKAGIGFVVSFNKEDGTTLEPSDAEFKYNIAYYTSLGSIASYVKKSFTCKDMEKDLPGACQKGTYSQIRVFVPWNLKTSDGTPIGSGAYIQKAVVSATHIKETEEVRSIGIIRASDSKIRILSPVQEE